MKKFYNRMKSFCLIVDFRNRTLQLEMFKLRKIMYNKVENYGQFLCKTKRTGVILCYCHL